MQKEFGSFARYAWGFVGGAPVVNRLFAFGYYEGYRNTRGTTDTRTVLSASQRAGDFSGAAIITDPLTGQPFEGNRIPTSRLDPTAAALLAAYVPLPNQPGNRITHSPDVVDRRHQAGGRLDFQANMDRKVMGRVLLARTEQLNPLGPANFSPAGNVARADLLDALVAHTWLIGSSVFNELRVSTNRIDARPTVTSGLDPRDLGFAIVPEAQAGLSGTLSLRITQARARRTIGLTWRTDRPLAPPAARLRDYVVAHAPYATTR